MAARRWLRISKVARLLDVGETTLRRWVKAGVFPPGVQVRGLRRWDRKQVNAWRKGIDFGFFTVKDKVSQAQKKAARDRQEPPGATK